MESEEWHQEASGAGTEVEALSSCISSPLDGEEGEQEASGNEMEVEALPSCAAAATPKPTAPAPSTRVTPAVSVVPSASSPTTDKSAEEQQQEEASGSEIELEALLSCAAMPLDSEPGQQDASGVEVEVETGTSYAPPPLERKLSGKVPQGWEQRVRPDGKVYYVHMRTGEESDEPYDRCGTHGCILRDRHAGLHVFEFSGSRERSRQKSPANVAYAAANTVTALGPVTGPAPAAAPKRKPPTATASTEATGPVAEVDCAVELSVGMRVRARYLASLPKEKRRKRGGAMHWYDGMIKEKAPDGTCTIHYDDDEIETGVLPQFIIVLQDSDDDKGGNANGCLHASDKNEGSAATKACSSAPGRLKHASASSSPAPEPVSPWSLVNEHPKYQPPADKLLSKFNLGGKMKGDDGRMWIVRAVPGGGFRTEWWPLLANGRPDPIKRPAMPKKARAAKELKTTAASSTQDLPSSVNQVSRKRKQPNVAKPPVVKRPAPVPVPLRDEQTESSSDDDVPLLARKASLSKSACGARSTSANSLDQEAASSKGEEVDDDLGMWGHFEEDESTFTCEQERTSNTAGTKSCSAAQQTQQPQVPRAATAQWRVRTEASTTLGTTSSKETRGASPVLLSRGSSAATSSSSKQSSAAAPAPSAMASVWSSAGMHIEPVKRAGSTSNERIGSGFLNKHGGPKEVGLIGASRYAPPTGSPRAKGLLPGGALRDKAQENNFSASAPAMPAPAQAHARASSSTNALMRPSAAATSLSAPWAFRQNADGSESEVGANVLLEDQGFVKALQGLSSIRAKKDELDAWLREADCLPAGPVGLLVKARASSRGSTEQPYVMAEVIDSRERSHGSGGQQVELQLRGPAEWRPLTQWIGIEFVSNRPLDKADFLSVWQQLNAGHMTRLSCGDVTRHAARLRRCRDLAKLGHWGCDTWLSFASVTTTDHTLLSDFDFVTALYALSKMHLRYEQLLTWCERSEALPGGPVGMLLKLQNLSDGRGRDSTADTLIAEVLSIDPASRERLLMRGPPHWRPLSKWVSVHEVADGPLCEDDLLAAMRLLDRGLITRVSVGKAKEIAERARRCVPRAVDLSRSGIPLLSSTSQADGLGISSSIGSNGGSFLSSSGLGEALPTSGSLGFSSADGFGRSASSTSGRFGGVQVSNTYPDRQNRACALQSNTPYLQPSHAAAHEPLPKNPAAELIRTQPKRTLSAPAPAPTFEPVAPSARPSSMGNVSTGCRAGSDGGLASALHAHLNTMNSWAPESVPDGWPPGMAPPVQPHYNDLNAPTARNDRGVATRSDMHTADPRLAASQGASTARIEEVRSPSSCGIVEMPATGVGGSESEDWGAFRRRRATADHASGVERGVGDARTQERDSFDTQQAQRPRFQWSTKSAPDRMRREKEPCKFYARGACQRGRDCAFAHVGPSQRSPPLRRDEGPRRRSRSPRRSPSPSPPRGRNSRRSRSRSRSRSPPAAAPRRQWY